jgi:hypothetical protein
MYLRISEGFGEPASKKRRRKGPVAPPPEVAAPRPAIPADRLIFVAAGWRLYVRFREDFTAFRQEVARAVARHNTKATNDLEKLAQEQKLKAIHDELKRRSPKLTESDIIPLRADIWFTRAGDYEFNNVYVQPTNLIYERLP